MDVMPSILRTTSACTLTEPNALGACCVLQVAVHICKPTYLAMHDTNAFKHFRALQEVKLGKWPQYVVMEESRQKGSYSSHFDNNGWAILRRVDN